MENDGNLGPLCCKMDWDLIIQQSPCSMWQSGIELRKNTR